MSIKGVVIISLKLLDQFCFNIKIYTSSEKVTDGTNGFDRTNSDLSNTYSNEKKQYMNTQEGDLLKRINYSSDNIKKELTYVIFL